MARAWRIEYEGAYYHERSCYIHRNPLRAGMIKRLAEHKWNSYLAYPYGNKTDKWLKTELILGQLKGDKKKRRTAYRKKVQKYSNEEKNIWADFKHDLFYGSEIFVSEMKEEYLFQKHNREKPQQKSVRRSTNVM